MSVSTRAADQCLFVRVFYLGAPHTQPSACLRTWLQRRMLPIWLRTWSATGQPWSLCRSAVRQVRQA